MSESQVTGATKRVIAQQSRHEPDRVTPYGELYLVGPLQKQQATQPLPDTTDRSRKKKTPPWLRPFFSLQMQLTLGFCLLLILVMAFTYLLLYQEPNAINASFAVAGIVVLGTALAYVLTSLLLRPLSRLTDAAQAIAIGDLAQRERLPLRLPPQDEVDRLAGSIDEMVTRLEHAEATQKASQERFRQFFSDASHQLRTPLTSIRGFTELLMRGAKDDPEISPRILSRMHNESKRMTLLIEDLLTLARLDDTHPVKMQYIDLAELATQEIERTRTRATDERTIGLEINSQGPLGLQADRDRIKQLIFILLDNALKYGRPAPDGKITLKLNRQNSHVALTVTDNGEGIMPDDLEHIFEAFYRGRHRSTAQPSTIIGTGLGLTIASAITRAHHGAITVCSEPGKTEFKIILPCAD